MKLVATLLIFLSMNASAGMFCGFNSNGCDPQQEMLEQQQEMIARQQRQIQQMQEQQQQFRPNWNVNTVTVPGGKSLNCFSYNATPNYGWTNCN